MKVEHITINTADLDGSIAFYSDVIGLHVKTDMRESGKPIVFLSFGDDDTCIELIGDATNKYSGMGISIGFHVGDVDEAHRMCKQKGLKPTAMIKPAPNTKFFFIKDPNGVNVQII